MAQKFVIKWLTFSLIFTDAPVSIANQEVIGVGIPIKPQGEHTLYCNSILEPAPMLIVSVETAGVFQHLALGALEKIGDWGRRLDFLRQPQQLQHVHVIGNF